MNRAKNSSLPTCPLREEKSFLKGLCDTECYVKIASIASGQFQSELPIFRKKKINRNLYIKENIDETVFMFALFKCGKSDKGRN